MVGSLRCGNSRGRGVYGWKGLRSQSVTEDEIVNYSDEPIDRRLEISHLSMVHGTVFFVSFSKDSLEFLEFFFSQSRRLLDFWINRVVKSILKKKCKMEFLKVWMNFRWNFGGGYICYMGGEKRREESKIKTTIYFSPSKSNKIYFRGKKNTKMKIFPK